MTNRNSTRREVLGLRVGEVVEVRSPAEIYATLDDQGRLDALPFMPEMLAFCGQRFTVFKRADKTCDTIDKTGGLRLFNTVHLGGASQPHGVRCDGRAHGGCEASCLLFWNEAWLKRVEPQADAAEDSRTQGAATSVPTPLQELLERSAMTQEPGKPGPKYRCQATLLKSYTVPLPWWDMRQYMRDLTSGNVGVGEMLRAIVFAGYRRLVKFGVGYRALLAFYNWFQAKTGGAPWPYIQGSLSTTPHGETHLQPGELVRIKPVEAIRATLNSQNRNRGLLFAPEMVRFCGSTYKVLKRVNRIVDEKTGYMLELSNPCIILDNVYCLSEYSERRVFCPRGIYSYWREIWLERVESAETVGSTTYAPRGSESLTAAESAPVRRADGLA